MNSFRLSILGSITSSIALCALLAGCGQTTGSGDTGPDGTDVVSADVVTPDATDVVTNPDVATSDTVDAAPPDVFDAAAMDAQPDVINPSDVLPSPDVSSPDVMFADVPAGSCNATLADGPVVTITAGTGTPPVGTGGTIVSGHYQLISLQVWGTTPPPISAVESIDITATTLNVVAAPTGMPEQRVTLTYTLSGHTFNQVQTCPAGGMSGSNDYTADATHFTVMSTMSGVTSVGVFQLH